MQTTKQTTLKFKEATARKRNDDQVEVEEVKESSQKRHKVSQPSSNMEGTQLDLKEYTL